MKVGIIQSNYLPWRGYFDFVDEVDLFIVHDDLQYTKGDWRNRNRIKTPDGTRWLTVPVHYDRTAQLICETAIDYSRDWRREHRHAIESNLARAPYLEDALSLLEPAWQAGHETISGLNVALIAAVCRYLEIETPLRMSSEFSPSGAKTERLIGLLTGIGATTYLSGPAGRDYLDEQRFEDAGIRLVYKDYTYAPYPQCWGDFDGAVSIVDTIANCGPQTRQFLKTSPEAGVAA